MAVSYVPMSNAFGASCSLGSGKDLNDRNLPSGFYHGYNATNGPASDIYAMFVVRYSKDWIVQVFMPIRPDSINRIYMRHFYSGTTWSAWSVVHSD